MEVFKTQKSSIFGITEPCIKPYITLKGDHFPKNWLDFK